MSKESEIWISNPVGKDFKIDLLYPPHTGDYVKINDKVYRVKGTLYNPSTTEYEKTNKCSVTVQLETIALEDAPE